MTIFESPRLGLQYPDLPEGPVDIPAIWLQRTNIMDAAALVSMGNQSSETEAGTYGRFFVCQDVPSGSNFQIDFDNGSFWQPINQADGPNDVPCQRTLGFNAGQAMPGNATRTIYYSHSFTQNDQSSPDDTATILGSFFIRPAVEEVATFICVIIHCVSVGSIPSSFAVRRLPAGTSGNNPANWVAIDDNLSTLVPENIAVEVTPAGSPITLNYLDGISLFSTNAGNSKGCTIDIITGHTR